MALQLPSTIWFIQLTLIMSTVVMNFTFAQEPASGGKIILTQHCLDYAADQVLQSLSGDITGQTINDMSGSADIGIGHVSYEFTGMHITGFGKPASTVTVSPTTGISWTLEGASVSMQGNWKYTIHTIFKHSSHGTFDLSASGVGITASVMIGEASGKPTVHATGCSSHVGDVDVKFHGGDSWLLNLFRDNAEDAVEDAINKMLCTSVNNVINDEGTKKLADITLISPIGRDLMIDYSLMSAPDFNNNMIAVGLKGEVFWAANRTASPLSPSPLPPGGAQMVTLMLSDYIINTLGYTEQTHANVQYNLTHKDLSENSTCVLNISCTSECSGCLGDVFTQLKNAVPNATFEIDLTSVLSPTLNTTVNRMSLIFGGKMDFYGRLTNNTRLFLFSSYTNATVQIKAYNNGTIIQAEATKFDSISNITAYNPVTGQVYAAQMKMAVGVIAQVFILPQLTSLGQRGFPLPSMKDVLYVNPTLNMTQGALILSTDLQYNPSSEESEATLMRDNVVDQVIKAGNNDLRLRFKPWKVKSPYTKADPNNNNNIMKP